MQINHIVFTQLAWKQGSFPTGSGTHHQRKCVSECDDYFEVTKDPTDGRKVSKLDTDHGVILSLEATTSAKGDFVFNMPAYKASGDAYTFTFKCLNDTTVLTDIRCGDVWVFLGSDFLSVPMKEANATKAPLKRRKL